MLDLNELERQLDEALGRETNESLSQWLASKRTNDSITVNCYSCEILETISNTLPTVSIAQTTHLPTFQGGDFKP